MRLLSEMSTQEQMNTLARYERENQEFQRLLDRFFEIRCVKKIE